MSRQTSTLQQLASIYADAEKCAGLVGLRYGSLDEKGYGRRKAGRGFVFIDNKGKPLVGEKTKQRLKELVIPPAWQDVWISPDGTAHILATGTDERGRKQYIYHPKWRIARDLLKFYHCILFAEQLPKIRRIINEQMSHSGLGREKVIATMLWILDNTYIRIGNSVYFEENESVGLTTLADHNIVIADTVVTLSFKAKSGKQQQFSIEDKRVAKIMTELNELAGERFFQYKDDEGKLHSVEAIDLNEYLKTTTGTSITAKDFRTWGGTLLAFNHLIENHTTSKKTEKIIVEAVDAAADVLGNTRAVARASYVHPHILDTYGSKNFDHYYEQAKTARKLPHLDKREVELLHFLKLLFEEEFDLLKQHK